jgi:hypothetical protein
MERHRVMLGNIDPDLWAKVKAESALAKKPIAQWVEEVLWEAVEDADDVRVSLERLNDGQELIGFEEAEELLNNARAATRQVSSSRSQGASSASTKRSGSHRKSRAKSAA